ncbi:MAG: AMP-binding protein, partial [Myxococcales bacterium]|nr:AMP-binding protein [Myxococcales bacterium]
MTFQPRFHTLIEVYDRAMRDFGDRPLFGVKGEGAFHWMTYTDFGDQVEAIRGGLASLGVGPGDRVAVISDNRPSWAVGAYATYGLGAAYVPLYPAQGDGEWLHILRDSNAKVVLVEDGEVGLRVAGFREQLPDLHSIVSMAEVGGPGQSPWGDLLCAGREHPVPCRAVSPDEVAAFIYTSGTTGSPKGVLLTHRNLANNVSAVNEVFPIRPEDRSLAFLPWAHSFGQVVELHTLFSMGASMGIAESVDRIVANLEEVRPTLLFSVPRIFNRIYASVQRTIREGGRLRSALLRWTLAVAARRRRLEGQGRSSLVLTLASRVLDRLVSSKIRARFGGRLRYAFSGGAAISMEVASFIDALGITVYEGYGLTETSPIVTANWPGSRRLGSVGKVLPGVRIALSDDGEIIVHGHNVMKGYHGLPEENAKVFTADGGFRTGDMGRIDEEGFLYITGRIKEQYKLENGKYVVPSPLEEQI